MFTTIRGSKDCSLDLSETSFELRIKADITDRAAIIENTGDFFASDYSGFAQVDHLMHDYPLSAAFDE